MKCPKCGSKRYEANLTIIIENALETKIEYDDAGTISIGFECADCYHSWAKDYMPKKERIYAYE
jgi:hypothetical protein